MPAIPAALLILVFGKVSFCPFPILERRPVLGAVTMVPNFLYLLMIIFMLVHGSSNTSEILLYPFLLINIFHNEILYTLFESGL